MTAPAAPVVGSPRSAAPARRAAVSAAIRRWSIVVTNHSFSLYGAAGLRIGAGLLFLAMLLREYPARHRLWGPHAAWSPTLDRAYAGATDWWWWLRDWYTLAAADSEWRFELSYALMGVIALVFALGWRTRLTAVLFLLSVTASAGRNGLVSDSGYLVLTIISVYLMFLRAGERWALDARRARKRGAPRAQAVRKQAKTGAIAELGEVRRRLVVLVHNCAVVGVAFQVCLIYGANGLYKAQGRTWQDGSALYYSLHIRTLRPWPGLSDWLADHGLVMTLVAYFTVFVEVGLPFVLFNRRLKYAFLAGLLAMHFGIAVVLALPWFSAIMIVIDAILLPEACYVALGVHVAAWAVAVSRWVSAGWSRSRRTGPVAVDAVAAPPDPPAGATAKGPAC